MSLDPELIAILACPEDKEDLIYVAEDEVLYNPRLHKAYDIRTVSYTHLTLPTILRV